MSSPKVAQKSPYAIELEQGKKYAWCSCGRSSKQPFCDGAHRGTDFKPVVFTADENSKPHIYADVRQRPKDPFCDGSHSKL